MSDELLPDSSAHESDCEASADDTATKKRDGDPKKEPKFTLKQMFDFGGIAGILIVWAEMIGEHKASKLIAYGIGLLILYLLLCHFIYEMLKKKCAWMPLSIWFLLAIGTSVFVVINSKQEVIEPIVSPARIQLNDGQWTVETPIDIYNPNDFPVYQVMLQFFIEGEGVRADSLNIRLNPDAKYESSIRMNYVHDPLHQIVFYLFPGLQSKHHVEFLASGNTPIKSYSIISVHDFHKEASEMKYLNGANWEIIPPHGAMAWPQFRFPVAGTATNFSIIMSSNVFRWTMTIQ